MLESSPQSKALTVIETNKAIALSFLDAIATGDIERIDQLLDPAVTYWVQGWGHLDRTRLITGLKGTITRSSSRKMDITYITAEDNRVAIAAEGEFRFPEGIYRNSYHYLFIVSNGQISMFREYLDTDIAARFYAKKA